MRKYIKDARTLTTTDGQTIDATENATQHTAAECCSGELGVRTSGAETANSVPLSLTRKAVKTV